MSTLYLIRHAQPEVQEYSNLFPGPNLGNEGKQQAISIAKVLANKGIEQILASDYPRVQQTIAPLLEMYPHLPVQYYQALWEREPTVETHESLKQRVQVWLTSSSSVIKGKTIAIFSHCGPINMILEYLDPHKTQLQYPYTSLHGCYTPCAGIWEIHFNPTGITGTLLLQEP